MNRPTTNNKSVQQPALLHADQGLAKKYADLLEEYTLQSKILEVGNRILKNSSSALALEEVFTEVINICQSALASDATTISLYDSNTSELIGVAKNNAPYNPDGYFRLSLFEASLSGHAFREGRVIAIDDVINDARVSQKVRQHFNARSGIAAPLIVDGKSIGVLLSMTTEAHHFFSQRDIDLMEGLATEAALAVNAQMTAVSQTENDNRFRRLMQIAPTAMLVLDKQSNIKTANDACSKLFASPVEELCDRSISDFIAQDLNPGINQMLDEADLDQSIHIECSLKKSCDTVIDAEIDAMKCSINGELITQMFIRDVSEARRLANEMSYLATHDQLTGLINRREFEKRIQTACRLSRTENVFHALLYFDLDQFKIVNDTCGHLAGDELLKQLSGLLHQHVRERDTLARLGGDEFGILLYRCPLNKASEIAESIRKLINEFCFIWEGRQFKVGASIGVCTIDSETNIGELMKSVDSACYAAKDAGRNRIYVYHPDDSALVKRRGDIQWTHRLSAALEDESLELYKQPIISLSGDQVEMAEILIRLREGNDLVLPSTFIPAAERYNLMTDIDEYVIKKSFQYILAQQHNINRKRFIHTINLSGYSIGQKKFTGQLLDMIAKSGINTRSICFEITETACISSLAQANRFVEKLRAMGCKVALDDFGTGLSSLNYLKHLPIDFLKIDGSFIRNIATDPVDRAMVETIHKVGALMGMETIAEKVESTEIISILREIGIDYAQGNAIGVPEPVNKQ